MAGLPDLLEKGDVEPQLGLNMQALKTERVEWKKEASRQGSRDCTERGICSK